MLRVAVLAVFLFASVVNAQESWLKIATKTLSQTRVQVNVQTNLPDGAWLGAQFIHSQQKPNDPALDSILERQKVKAGKAIFVLDMDKSTSTMPSGKWQITVFYSPLWRENQVVHEKYQLTYRKQSKELFLKAHGIDYKYWLSARARGHQFFTEINNGNINSYKAFLRLWDLNRMSKEYGPYTKFNPNKGNAEAAAIYYFQYLDMQFAVNKEGQLINMGSGRVLSSK
ncbi:hypothetical protein [Deinococcus fonticola]|uniref:hypothetical protein n=1 Tax=Deinococcus fonticola TaxID=2528713 RepID=UPI001074CC04|nr:hypothetical protein [Deinococcus fonticola]